MFGNSLINLLIAPLLMSLPLFFTGCGANAGNKVNENLSILADGESPSPGDVVISDSVPNVTFNADSAYEYIRRQVEFGPRVPNTEAHRLAGDWIVSELKRHGGAVIEQKADLKAFDGTVLKARNIFAQFNPTAKDRILLLAHWDCRPWADNDPDPANHAKPVDGANDGASGVGVLLETARQLSVSDYAKGVDILFVDAEDWGEEGNEDSWALGAAYFVENPPIPGYLPRAAILLDMVGGSNATFCREYFSERSAPVLAQQIWDEAHKAGFGDIFLNRMGSAVLDDHVQFIKAGIPAIDIIEYHPEDETGFNPRWHTVSDNLDGISKQTLNAVGTTLLNWLMK